MGNGLRVRVRSGVIDVDALRVFVESLPFARSIEVFDPLHTFAYALPAGLDNNELNEPSFGFGPSGAVVYVHWSDNPFGHASRCIDWVLSRYDCEGWDIDYGELHATNERCRAWLSSWNLDTLEHTPERAKTLAMRLLAHSAVVSLRYAFFDFEITFQVLNDPLPPDLYVLRCQEDSLEVRSTSEPIPSAWMALDSSEKRTLTLMGLINQAFGVRKVEITVDGSLALFLEYRDIVLVIHPSSDTRAAQQLWELVHSPRSAQDAETILLVGYAGAGVRVLGSSV